MRHFNSCCDLGCSYCMELLSPVARPVWASGQQNLVQQFGKPFVVLLPLSWEANLVFMGIWQQVQSKLMQTLLDHPLHMELFVSRVITTGFFLHSKYV